MKDLKLVLFDLDGTLFRTETIEVYSINKALELNGLEKRSPEDLLSLIGLTAEEAGEVLIASGNKVLIGKLMQDVGKIELEAIEKWGELYEGVEDLLKTLKESGMKLCICSNGWKDYIEAILHKFGLSGYFDEVWHYTDGITKPQAAGILKAKFGAESFIMVGDRTADINAARENGGVSIGAKYGFGPEEAMQADYVAESIKDVKEFILKIYNEG